MTDAELAAALAEAAGTLLLDLRREAPETGPALGVRGDQLANALIVARLQAERPRDGLLSEESADTLARLQRSRVWIIDPLDGTIEYGQRRDDWAVHVALAVDGTPQVGAVALPARKLVLRSDRPPALREPHDPPRLLVSRSRPPPLAERLVAHIGAQLVPLGSAGAKAAAVILGEGDIYLHAGGQHEWDNCAPAAVALAAGLHVSRLDGSPLLYNRQDTSVPDLLICHKIAAAELLARIAALRDEDRQYRL